MTDENPIALLALALGVASTAAVAQTVDCSPVSRASEYGGPLASDGIALITPSGDHAVSADVINGGIAKWTNACSESQRPPLHNGAVADGNLETWTVRMGRHADFPNVTVSDPNTCGIAPHGTSRTIYIFTEPHCKKKWRQIEILAHELGHAMRLGHSQCSDRMMYGKRTLRP